MQRPVRTLRTFAESAEGLMILEKCKVCGMSPTEVMNLSDIEDLFLTYAINESRKQEGDGFGKH